MVTVAMAFPNRRGGVSGAVPSRERHPPPQASRCETPRKVPGSNLSPEEPQLEALPQAHLSQLAHDLSNPVELREELLHLVRLRPAVPGDTFSAGLVDDVRVAPFLVRHDVDHGLDAPER